MKNLTRISLLSCSGNQLRGDRHIQPLLPCTIRQLSELVWDAKLPFLAFNVDKLSHFSANVNRNFILTELLNLRIMDRY